MEEQSGLTRRQMLRSGTLVGATAAWIAPSATVHAMSRALAEPTSGERVPPDDDSEEQPETTTPKDDDQPSEPTDNNPEEEEEEEDDEEDSSSEPTVEVVDSEPERPTEPEIEVKGVEIVAEVPKPPGAPSVNPPPVITAQAAELPRTGIDADILTGIGTGLTALGAAALRATRESVTD